MSEVSYFVVRRKERKIQLKKSWRDSWEEKNMGSDAKWVSPRIWATLNTKPCSEVKVSASNAGNLGSIPGLGRSPGEGNGNPLQYSCLENPMDGGAWWATVRSVAKSRTRLSDFTFTFHFQTQSISVLSTRFCKYLYPPWYSFVEILMSREMVWGDGALGKHLSHESEELVNEISAHIKRLSRAPSALWGYNKNSVTLKRAPSSWASSLPNYKKKKSIAYKPPTLWYFVTAA